MIQEAADSARNAFLARHKPLEIRCPEYEAESAAEDARLGFSAAYDAAGFTANEQVSEPHFVCLGGNRLG